ncbi:MAG: methyltransferase [archaeon]|nr:methyltransferase [archaeon]
MEYRYDLKISEDREVYPPSEDSQLFIESLDVAKGEKVLEIGCGSGIVSIHCALNGATVSCGDVNPRAVTLTRRNAEQNGADLEVRETDVYSAFDERYNTILFNLPYLPAEEDEYEGELVRSWAGGSDGMGPLPELLEHAPEHLLPGGRVVVVVSSLMDQDRLAEVLGDRPVEVLGELPLFFEKLQILQIRF